MKFVQLKTNANNLILKTCFIQEFKEKKYPIMYRLRKISKIKQNYNIHDKNFLIIIKTFQQ